MARVAVIIFIANYVRIIMRYGFGHGNLLGLSQMVDMDSENNLPTLYTVVLMLLIAALLLFISRHKQKNDEPYLAWKGLCLIFLFLSLDEFGHIHERLITPVRTLLDTSGVFYFAWIIPYVLVLMILAPIYLRLIMTLPRAVGTMFIISALCYLSGAVGVEMIGALLYEAGAEEQRNLTYELVTTVEEMLEITGLLLFFATLVIYIDAFLGSFQVRVVSDKSHKSDES
tara:strand:- start:304 stop:987 length:684 start_codon:yes stop_codon:yes gene_type:complete